jgi:DNA-binding response OmpR family regulator
MTLFETISPDRNGARIHFADEAEHLSHPQYRLIMVNETGAPRGKIDGQLRGLGFELSYLPEMLPALDDMDAVAGPCRAVILDWRSDLPKDSEFAERLAVKAAEAGLPVLTLAAAGRAGDIEIASRAGLSTIVSMPCRLAELKDALEALIERTQLEGGQAQDFELNDAAALLESCKFRFRTPADVEKLVPIIAKLFPEPERSAAGLAELMMNAIEHGNLEIGHERKAAWVARGIYRGELMKRLQTPPFSHRRAELIVNRREDGIMIVIMDEGCGFCWQDVVHSETHDDDAAAGHCGEGLARVSRESFDDVRFNQLGNQVTAFIADESRA